MDIIAKVFAAQWTFMLIAVVAVAVTFLIKKFASSFYETFLKGGLVILVVALVILALLFGAQDLFLLIPIIVMCCELFGYGVTGKIVGVLFVDFLLIQLDFRLVAGVNENVMNIIFIVLQIIAAICIGFIMDRYLRDIQAEKKDGKELTDEELKELDDETESDDETVEDVTDSNKSESDLEYEIDKIMSGIETDNE